MNTVVKESLKQLVADRYLLFLVSLLILMSLVYSTVIGLSIHSSELQLVSHYTAYGTTHFYTDQWYYLLVFVGFELVAAVLHSIIAVKLLIVRGHSIAVMFAWLGLGIITLGWITAHSVIYVYTSL